MPRKFVPINWQDMEKLLVDQLGFQEGNFPESGSEITYQKTYDNLDYIRVYSSINKRTGWTNPIGSDAIRVVVFKFKQGKHIKVPKTLRIKGWQTTLQIKLLDAIREHRLFNRTKKDCVVCGSEANGLTDKGELVCTWHQHITTLMPEGISGDVPVFGQAPILIRASVSM